MALSLEPSALWVSGVSSSFTVSSTVKNTGSLISPWGVGTCFAIFFLSTPTLKRYSKKVLTEAIFLEIDTLEFLE